MFLHVGAVERSDDAVLRARRLVITSRARHALRGLCRAEGRQAVLLAWPSGACYLPLPLYSPGTFDVIIGHVARCPIFCDVRQLDFYADRRAVLDVTEPLRTYKQPLLRLGPGMTVPIAGRG